MNVLVVGGGGREHAIVEKLHQSSQNPRILIAPGNAGTAAIAENVPIQPTAIDELLRLAREREVDLTMVGPEAPLCAGIVDEFQRAGLRIFGPTAATASIVDSPSAHVKMLPGAGGGKRANPRIGSDVMFDTAKRMLRRRTLSALCTFGFLFQFGGCDLGEITTTTTVDGRELIVSLLRGVILNPLDRFITSAVNDLFDEGNQ